MAAAAADKSTIIVERGEALAMVVAAGAVVDEEARCPTFRQQLKRSDRECA
jgi:hypothetical protein